MSEFVWFIVVIVFLNVFYLKYLEIDSSMNIMYSYKLNLESPCLFFIYNKTPSQEKVMIHPSTLIVDKSFTDYESTYILKNLNELIVDTFIKNAMSSTGNTWQSWGPKLRFISEMETLSL